MHKSISILIADDHPLLRKGLADLLSEQPEFDLVGAAGNGAEAFSMLLSAQPDIAVLDIEMPGLTGLEIAQKAGEMGLKSRIILLTMHKEPMLLRRARSLGVFGFLLKEFALSEIVNCIQQVHAGKDYYSAHLPQIEAAAMQGKRLEDLLTRTELKILRLVAQKKTTREIAAMLFVAPKTVENHRTNIARKLELDTRTNSLLLWAVEHADEIQG